MNAPEPPDDPALTDPGLKEFALSAPEITILSDHAARGSLNLSDSPDRLELRSRLAGIYDILRHRNTRCPVAIGLYGDWGSGKTSAMHWLESRLREWNRLTDPQRTESSALPGMLAHPRVHPVWFDPWKYHTREDVWRGIIAEVILALLNRPLFTGPAKLTALKFAARRFTSFLGSAFLTALSHVGVKAGAGEAGAELSGEVFSDLYKEWKDYRQPEKAFLNEFEAALLSFINECIPHSKVDDHTHYDERICLFIDDLDRCLPDVTLEVLEALKLYLNIPALVFVVGLDQHVVQAVVTQHYEKHGVHAIKARDYLAKLFQVELPIAPSAFQMDGFLTNQLTALNTATGGYWDRHLPGHHKERILEALSELTKSNPREIKRLLNSSLLFARALSEDTVLTTGPDALLKEDIFPSALAFFFIRRLIQLRYPSIEGRFETDDEEHLWLVHASEIRSKNGGDRARLVELVEWAALDNDSIKKATRKFSFPLGVVDLGPGGIQQMLESETKTQTPCSAPPDPGTWEERWIQLYRDRPADDKGPLVSPFFTDALLWELLVIPFHLRIAQRAPAAPESKPATPGLDLSALPPKVLEAILSATGETSTSFDPAKLTGIKKLVLTDAGLTDAHIPLLARCTSLEELELRDNPLSEAGLKPLASLPLRRLVLGGLKDVDTRPLTDFAALQELRLESCAGFCAVDFLPASLLRLHVLDCPRLTEVDHLPDRLRDLILTGSANLNAADHLPASLKSCYLDGSPKLTAVDNLPEGLETLLVTYCAGLPAVDHLPASLTTLYLTGCTGLAMVDDLPPSLTTLYLDGCTGLGAVDQLPACLTELYLNGCTGLSAVEQLPASLTTLYLSGCTGLSAVDQLPASLTVLHLNNCTGLLAVDQLPASLTVLHLNDCTGLLAVDQLPAFLTWLELFGCTGLSAGAVEKLKASRKWEFFVDQEGNE